MDWNKFVIDSESLIPDINYKNAIEKAKSMLSSWEYRNLTPMVNIMMLKKPLFCAKFTHLFTSIPVTAKLLKDIDNIFYEYLWDGEADKVNRHGYVKIIQ